MEEPLLCRRNLEEEKRKITWSGFAEELKAVSYMAVPMVAVSVSHYCLQVITMIMVGHLGELPLSGCALGVSFANVTGFSFIFGIAGALETLCGQAYGAQQYQKLGSYTYCSILSLYPICIPICFSWIFMDKLLVSLGQNPEISVEAGRYAIWLIPALLAYPILQSLIRYLQCQSLVLPMFLSSSAAVLLHTCLCWILTYKTSMGIAGGALSTGLALWFNVTLLVIYMRYSSACEKSRAFVFKDVLSCVKEIFSYGVPSAAMICLEWWSFELLILLSGLLPDSMLETSVLSICMTITTLHFFVPYGISAAASTRVSNELGAGNPEAARLSVIVATVIGLIEPIMVVTVFLSWRHVFGYIFSNEVEVVNYIAQIIPLLCISVFMDSLQAVLSGVARGTGWQHIGAYVNLGAYYLVGIPVAACLCFVAKWRGKGLWTGIVSGTTVQALVLAIVTASINWQKQANNARERIQEKPVRANNGAA
ncbi:protein DETOXIFICATION 2-like isoform X1 [Hibiscus syriacus]|uniref:protein DETOXIFICATION 2-like isoform X1 n=1 Tax=Hibiscus syriacus TaxID=106335 RepID=UPI0019224615|nr:protein DETOXIFICATION 2-like isoform X1 [Hibiscus syriacus]